MQNTPAVAPQKTSDEIDLLALLGALLDNKGTIIACTLVFALFGIAYALLSTPVYVANATIQIEQKTSGVGNLLGNGEVFASGSATATEIELLKSRQVIGQAVDNLKLTIAAQPKLLPIIRPFIHRRFPPTNDNPVAPPFLGFDSFAWGGEQIDVFQLDVPPSFSGTPLVLIAEGNGTYKLTNMD